MWLIVIPPETAEHAWEAVVCDEHGQFLACSNWPEFLLPWLVSQGQTVVAVHDAAGVRTVEVEPWLEAVSPAPAPANRNDPPGQAVNGDPSTDLGFELRPPRRFSRQRPLPFVREPL